MSHDVLVRVDSASKRFCRDLKRSLWYGVTDIFGELSGGRNSTRELREGEFWSVRDVSFELKRGECLGLIGPNGAGKSTLLKMLNGTLRPDRGRISIRGRVGALIELGAGFNPSLTGRENIYVNAAVLGFGRKEIDDKFSAILDFSGLAEFIDAPLHTFSSGMRVRLGFAIASHLDPDVLLIDEVLAVGDVGFRARCFDRIARISKMAALIFVSHSMPEVARISSRVLLLKDGSIVFNGDDVAGGINQYLRLFSDAGERYSGGWANCKLHSVTLRSCDARSDGPTLRIDYGRPLEIEIVYTLDSAIRECLINIAFVDQERRHVAQCSSIKANHKAANVGEVLRTVVAIASVPFGMGRYDLSFYFVEDLGNNRRGEVFLFEHAAARFEVFDATPGFSPVEIDAVWMQLRS
jgi:lipopolysaccharide transport system ATP-binding protein